MKAIILSRRLILASLFFSLLLFAFPLETKGQKIDRDRPSVYLTFKEFVKKTASETHPSQGARLVLHNNTRWPIYYGKWFDQTLPGDVPLIYIIEMRDG